MISAFCAALALGGLWGFVEVVFSYLTGFAPAADGVEIFLAPVAALLLYRTSVAAMDWLRPHRVFGFLGEATLLLPMVTLAMRNRGPLTLGALMTALTPIGLGLMLVMKRVGKADPRRPLSPTQVPLIFALYFGATLNLSLRLDRVSAITTPTLLGAAALCAGLALSVVVTVAVIKRFTGPSVFALSALAALLVAWQWGSAPPLPNPGVPSSPDSGKASEQGLPNVLLVVLDTVRADHLDLYGYARPTFSLTGPYLQQGLVFDRAISNGTFSLPSHGSLFTGKLPSAHGAHSIVGGQTPYGRLWPDVETMADWLRRQGYATAGISANDVFLAEWTGLQRGFDSFSALGVRGLRFSTFSSAVRSVLSRAKLLDRRTSSLTWSAGQVTDAAIGIVGAVRKPFFLFLNYFDAHQPHTFTGAPAWLDPKAAAPIDAYDTEIAAIDAQIARLLDSLDKRGLLDHTLLIVTADHGEYFGERKLRGHPAAVWEQSTHVPLGIRLPGVVTAARSERRIGLHEVFQIVRDVVEKKSLTWLTQIDLTPRILTEAWARRDYDQTPPKDGRPSTTVVFSGNLKLIHRLSGNHDLFDLDSDPGEGHNLFGAEDPAIASMRERMLREVTLRVTRGPGPAPALSEDAKERLRALGYLR